MKSLPLGHHLLIEYFDCPSAILNDLSRIRNALLEGARLGNATVVQDVFHTFNPHGISGVIVIAESHIAIHTWPEHGCASVDIFSCSSKMNSRKIAAHLEVAFESKKIALQEVPRGILPGKQSILKSPEATAEAPN